MTDQHPITPPPELVQEWCATKFGRASDIATQAARWGADQELEACVEWLEQNCGRWDLPAALRAARRPKPPSLKEQALAIVTRANRVITDEEQNTIRLALEQLND